MRKIFGGDEDEATAKDETLREEAADGAHIFEYLIRRFKVNVYNVDDAIAIFVADTEPISS